MSRRSFLVLIAAVFFFRLVFGLCQSHWSDRLEQVQHYLVGLKFYTTQAWPFFGVDMFASESSFHTQLPGALFGLFIGLPFFILPIPEAPFVLVNLLSTAGAALLAWYIQKRLPALSLPWLFLWIAVVPWSLHYSTHIYNMCFILLPSVLFFIGFLESLPQTSLRLIPSSRANFLMGLGLLWIVQFHFSYVLLLPFAGLSILLQARAARSPAPAAFFAMGALVPFAFLAPTFVKFGLGGQETQAGLGFLSSFNWDNVGNFFTLLARYLSLVSSEIPRWIGPRTADRLGFLNTHWPLWGPGALLWIVGLLQPFALVYLWFRKKGAGPHWREIKVLALAGFLLAWMSFWFTVKKPLSHQYLILFPLLMIYSCYAWALFAKHRRLVLAAKAFIVASFLFQAGYALAVAPKESIWTQRARIQSAIDAKDYRLFEERREGSFY